MGEDNGVQISFDDECRIRVLDPEQFKHSETLEQECSGFVDKIRKFNTSVHTIVEVLHENAARIDKEKLKAIGQRNKVQPCVAVAYLPYHQQSPFREDISCWILPLVQKTCLPQETLLSREPDAFASCVAAARRTEVVQLIR